MANYENNIDEIESELKKILCPDYPRLLQPKRDALRKRRKQMKLTQPQLADETGVPQATISNIETGKVEETDTEGLYALSKRLQCDLDDIAVVPPHLGARITPAEFDRIAPQILEVVNVRTLARPGVRVDLRTFYYRTKLVHDDGTKKTIREVNHLRDLGNRPVLIQGVAGQGKSIFLRYLTAKTFEERTSLPLFFELRHFKGKTIRDTVAERIHALGFKFDEETLTRLLREGRVSLFVDAYDELAQDYRTAFAEELGELHTAFPEMPILLSSRPHTGTIHDCLEVFEIEPIGKDEIIEAVQCYTTDEEAKDISERLHLASVEMIGLLSSPLMILLLVIHFQDTHSIPESVARFYQDLFDVLIRRHNRSEGRLKRPITSGLNRRQLQLFFQALCFLVKGPRSPGDIHISDLEDIASDALALCEIQACEQDALEDVIVITNLIVEEGGVCFYVHRTVQEYYAAAHVRSMTTEKAVSFYDHLLNNWPDWDGEICFLLIIDRIRCIKNFCIPDLVRCTPFTLEATLSACSVMTIAKQGEPPATYMIDLAHHQQYCLREIKPSTWEVKIQKLKQIVNSDIAGQVLDRLTSSQVILLDRRVPFEGDIKPDWEVSTLVHAAENRDRARTHIEEQLKPLQDQLETLQAEVQREQERDLLFNRESRIL